MTWNLARLKDVKSNKPYAIVDGPFGSAISTNDYKDEGVPLVRIVNLTGKELDPNTTMFISSELAESVQRSSFCLNDIIFAKTGATVGKCSINTSIEYGILSSSCVKISIAKEFLFNYYYYFFSTYQFNLALRLACGGSTRDTINLEPFKNLPCLIPPLSEQQRIASYLDKKCGEIDELIALQEKMIAQLTEYKQAVITEAVTKGLDPNAKLVPSGIEWIGDVPEGWKVCKMKYLCNYIKDGTHFSPNTVAEGYPYITATDVRGVGIDYNNAKKVTKEVFIELQKAGCQPHKGDILLVKDGATTGRVGMMADDTECVLLSSVAMLSTNNKTTNKYLMYILMSDLLQSQMKLSMAGAALPRITLIKLTNFISLYAPLPEQHSIATYLDSKCSEIDTLITLKRQKIESLNAYKKSVIYEAVTGKTII